MINLKKQVRVKSRCVEVTAAALSVNGAIPPMTSHVL